jgi:hypothetical protein
MATRLRARREDPGDRDDRPGSAAISQVCGVWMPRNSVTLILIALWITLHRVQPPPLILSLTQLKAIDTNG